MPDEAFEPDEEFQLDARRQAEWDSLRIEWVDPQDIEVDETYQRPEHEAHYVKMAREWMAGAYKVVNCAERRNRVLYVTDGHHEVLAAQLIGLARIPVLVCPMASVQREAQAFAIINTNRRKLGPLDHYRADVRRREPTALVIERVVKAHGIEMAQSNRTLHSRCQCYTALRQIVDAHGEKHLDRTLAFAAMAWDGEQFAYASDIVRAVALLLATWWPDDPTNDADAAVILGRRVPVSYRHTAQKHEAPSARGSAGGGHSSVRPLVLSMRDELARSKDARFRKTKLAEPGA